MATKTKPSANLFVTAETLKVEPKKTSKADNSGNWAGNGLRFATKEEAEGNVKALAAKWFMVTDTRVVECDDPVNYRWVDGRAVGSLQSIG